MPFSEVIWQLTKMYHSMLFLPIILSYHFQAWGKAENTFKMISPEGAGNIGCTLFS